MSDKADAAPARPRVPMRPCAVCKALSDQFRCPEHRAQRRDNRTTTERGYGWDWQQLQAAKLIADPICELRIVCRGAVAREVHHVESVEERPDLRLVWENLRSACIPCHAITRRKRVQHRRV